MKKILFLLIILIPTFVFSQFSCDYSANTQFTNLTADNILPHLVTDSNGNTYISWYAANANTYSMNLQLIDADGNKLWTNDLVISTFLTDTWVTDYSIIVDNENNCILAFNDYRNSATFVEQDISVYKISPSGEMLWGTNGITFTNPTEVDIFPHLLVTPTNQIIVAWANYNYFITLQKLSTSGELLWGADGIIFKDSDPTIRYQRPEILNADDENIFLIWTHETGNTMYPNKNIYLQKLNSNGETVLSVPTQIYANGDIPIYISPTAKSDNAHGAYITWICFVNGVLQSFVNHVDVNGNLTMPENGIAMQDNTNFMRTMPTLSIDKPTNDVCVFWKQSNLNESQNGIYGQKFDANGQKLWNDGIEYIPLSDFVPINFETKNINNNSLLFIQAYNDGSAILSKLSAKFLDKNGNPIWDKTISAGSEKLDCYFSDIKNKQAVAVWADKRSGNDNIYIQNIFAYSINLGNDTTIYKNETLTLDAGSDFTTYLWNDLLAQQTQTLTINAADYSGINIFSVLAKDLCNFEYTDEITVEILELNSIQNTNNENIKIYPNPTTNFIEIDLSFLKNETSEINIFDISGKQIYSNNLKNNTINKINLSNFEKGIYFVKITNQNKKYYNKIIKN